MASTIPAAKAALKVLLEAHTWPVATPDIRWGGPTETEDFPQGGELIYFGDTEMEIPSESLRLGRTSFEENYDLRVVIDVRQLGDDEQAAEQRAWDLYGAVAAVLDDNANRTLTATVNRLTGRSVRQTNIPLPQDWLARITVDQGVVGHVVNP